MAETKSKSSNIPKLSEVIKSTVSNIKEITDATKVIVGSVEDLAKLIPDDFDQNVQKIHTSLISGINGLNNFIIKFNKIKLQTTNDELLTNINNIFFKINNILTNILNINTNIGLLNRIDLGLYKNIIEDINNIITLLCDNIKTFVLFNIKSKILISGFKSLIIIFSSFKILLNFGIGINLYKSLKWEWFSNALSGITKSMLLLIALTPLVILFLVVSPIIFIGLKLFMILIRYFIRLITRNLKFLTIKQYLSLKMKLGMVNALMWDIAVLMLKIILISPIIALFIILSPIILLGGLILTAMIWGIMKLLSLVSVKLIMNTMGKISLISLLFLGIGLVLLSVIIISDTIASGWKSILIFFGSILVIIAAVLLIGGLFSLAGPLISAAILGLGITLIAVSLFVLIALELVLIQNLNINSKAIKNVILCIKETILSILNILFDDSENPEESKPKGFFETMLDYFGKILSFSAGVLTMISAVPLLILAVISVGIILLIATELRIIQALNLDTKTIYKNVSLVLATVKFITNILFTNPENIQDSNNNKSWFRNVITNGVNWFSNRLSPIIDSILAIGVLALSVISVTLILIMAGQLRLLQIMDLQPDKIKENVKTVIDTAKYIIHMLFYTSPDYQESESKSWWSNVITWASENIPGFSIVRAIGQIIEGILAIGVLALSTVSISLLLLMASELRLLQAMDLDAKTIKDRATNVLSTAKLVISSLWDGTYDVPQNNKSWDRKLFEFCLPDSLVMMADALSNIGILAPLMISIKMFSMMAESMTTLAKYENVGTAKIKTTVENVLSDAKGIINVINSSDVDLGGKFVNKIEKLQKITTLNLVIDTINKLGKDVNVNNHTKLTDNTIRLIDKIDKSKLENLQTAHNMFKEMKEFSESISGNFDGLAEALNEKIAPLLEELKELIGKIPESVDKSASTISTSMYNTTSIANGTANASTMAQQVQSENPTMSKEDIGKVVDQRMAQQAQSVNKGIEMKLEELIDVLQNYSNPIPVRMS